MGALIVCVCRAASGQDRENAILRARDAFGERIGLEQTGIYSESQMRGFDLSTAGAYRLEGHYFLREWALPDTIIDGVSSRVGINVVRQDFPSPSGVVDYRLKSAGPGAKRLSVTAGVKEFGAKFANFDGAISEADGRYGLAGGLIVTPEIRYFNATHGHGTSVGAVPYVTLGDRGRVRGLISFERASYNGEFAFQPREDVLPPRLPLLNFGVNAARVHRKSWNAGFLAEYAVASDWLATGTLIYAGNQKTPSDATILAVTQTTAAVSFLHTVRQRNQSLAAEGTLRRTFVTGTAAHTLIAAFRAGDANATNASRPALAAYSINLFSPTFNDVPVLDAPASKADASSRQRSWSVMYQGSYRDLLEVRGGLHRTSYYKSFALLPSRPNERMKDQTLYNLSAVVVVNRRIALFAATVRGLEESGVAPQSAVNQYEVLPPVIAKQFELGAKVEIAPNLTLNAAAFDVQKQIPGFASNGVYGLVGTDRHSGVEASLAGRVLDSTSIVVGGVLMRPRLSGGAVGLSNQAERSPPNVSAHTGLLSVNHRLSQLRGVSLDFRLTWQSPRYVTVANTYRVPGFADLAVGFRYELPTRSAPTYLRFVVSNLLSNRPYVIGAPGLVVQRGGVTARATVQMDFGTRK